MFLGTAVIPFCLGSEYNICVRFTAFHKWKQIRFLTEKHILPCLECPLGLKLTPDIKWNAYIRCLRKRCWKNDKFLVSHQKIKKLLLPCSSFIRVRTNQVWTIDAISWLVLADVHCPALTKFKIIIGTDELFSTLQNLSHRRNFARLSLLHRYYSGRCSGTLYS